MAPHNQAAWIPAKKMAPFVVGAAPYTPPGPGQIVIKNGAVGINPYDWVLQYQGGLLASHLKYPMVLGIDVVGTVVEVGPDVTRFKVGDRVTGSAASVAKESNSPSEGAFQLYTVVRQHMVALVPESITDEQAAVFGLGFGTAAYGLFHKDYLGLDMPQVPPPPNPRPGKKYPRAIIVTGGASSVGSCAVQLAASAGYEVLSTSSPKNFAYVKGLGASHVFDYNSKTLVGDFVRALEGRELVGAFTVGANADQVCAAVMKERLSKMPELPTREFVSLAGGSGMNPDLIKGILGPYRMMRNMMMMMGRNVVKRILTGVEVKFILIVGLVDPGSCVSKIYLDFLGPALAARQIVPAPEPLVVGRGLEKINEALDLNQKGVSAKKIVVSLP
ncbi:putative zinc-binding oxidoreductase protein [Phaeoacremonium minimum UCRPA7]|uniref:Putative zinc-binding oxidoreductase protein n=1 Tax=Phaeoacremonium minimum (strain UCR-PA7) TaxID=1286976 RepID=R8BVK4_PHAM7|nr:putative zinc-binding oxidoreductase protein [Phaeoacremonium minimum UCRPA7]EOO03388.1 putative zinc-binding oxidoreductase protein [Phaeoacremonium minimum UCRPA7]